MAKAEEIVGLDCAARAQAGIALVLHTRFMEMYGFREAALDRSEPKGVHDMRVASRRLRSAIGDFAPYLRGRLPRKRLRQLADTLGAVRDEDVALTALEKLMHEAETETDKATDLRSIHKVRCDRRDKACALLALALEGSALDALRQKFLRKLEHATAATDETDQAGDTDALSFKEMGREVILARLDDLIARSRAIQQPSNVKRLHDLRIAAKRLRYALELFVPCWDEQLQTHADDVAKLQKALGDMHDCDVWIEELGALLEQTRVQKDSLTDETIATLAAERGAIFHLLSHFTNERTCHFRAALAHWANWEATSFFQRLRETL
jgi:CHAD domain-containing protein